MVFKKFTKTNQRSESRITITSSFSFGFPTKFYNDNKIDRYKYVILFHDLEENAVGIHFTNNEDEKHKFTIIRGNKYGGSIIATSFFKVNNINPRTYKGRYSWKKQRIPEVGELYVIKLEEKDQKRAVREL